MIYHFWISGIIALLTVFILFSTVTPAYDTLSDYVDTTNFSVSTVDEKFHQQVTYMDKMWRLWPIAAGIMVFFAVFIGTAQEEEVYRGA